MPAYRYGAVFLCSAAVLVFLAIAPAADWSRAVALAIQGLALVVAVATSRDPGHVRRMRSVIVGGVAVLLVGGVAAGLVSPAGAMSLSALAGIGASLALVGGLMHLARRQGATLQAVAGGLAIYLQVGLIFAWVAGLIAHLAGVPYFTNDTDGTPEELVYYSFTVMTSTGFGDFTPAEPAGRALAVVEMLIGQLYLVTVIGVLIGRLVERRPR